VNKPQNKHPKIENGLRVASAIGCLLAGVVGLLLGVALIVGVYHNNEAEQDSVDFNFTVIWIVASTLTLLGFLTLYMGWRLWRGKKSSNGITLTPAWCIKCLGGVFFFNEFAH
jgi:hypothetical protein